MTDNAHPEEWPLQVQASQVGDGPLALTATATPAVRDALARRFDILAIDSLEAEVTLRRLTDGDIAAAARLRAALSQACVVTLEPVAQQIDTLVEGRFSERVAAEPTGDQVVDIALDDDSDEPEPIVGGVLHLGEWLAQQLSLALDPYPRAADAAVDSGDAAGEAPEAAPTKRPFAGLADLLQDKGKK